MAAAGRLLSPLHERMAERALSSKAIHTDDTPVPVLDRDRKRTRQGRLWTYRGDDLHPYTVYDYTPSRARDGPAAFLKAFEGYLHADAYGGYDGMYAGEKVIEVLCWAHARRKFFEAQETDTARSAVALAYVRRLYRVERQAKELFEGQQQGDDARPLSAIRLELRQERSVGILKEFEAWLRQQTAGVAADGSSLPSGPACPGEVATGRSLVLPKSPMGMAINYCLGNWQALTRYTGDGDLDIDNNASERDLRPVVVGRKNYLFLGSDNGGRTAAVLYSLIATAKRHGLDPFAYLRDVIARISDHPSNRLDELLPDHWKLASAAV
jgi:hypothetical protein